MGDELPTAKVIPFPRQFRVVPVGPPAPAAEPIPDILVDHDGRAYRFADLARGLTPKELRAIEAATPTGTAQQAWDEAVRRWPALAAEIAAGCQPAG